MRYMLLIHGSEDGWDALSDADRSAQYERYGKLQSEMEEHGTTSRATSSNRRPPRGLVRVRTTRRSSPTDPSSRRKSSSGGISRWVRPRDGARVRGAIPAAEGGTIEVRPIVEGPDA